MFENMFYYRNFCRVISLLHGFNYENIFLIHCHIFLKKKKRLFMAFLKSTVCLKLIS